jgi:hypothetical protein
VDWLSSVLTLDLSEIGCCAVGLRCLVDVGSHMGRTTPSRMVTALPLIPSRLADIVSARVTQELQ